MRKFGGRSFFNFATKLSSYRINEKCKKFLKNHSSNGYTVHLTQHQCNALHTLRATRTSST